MSTTHIDVSPDSKRVARQIGYAIAVLVNLVMLFVVHNILDWGTLVRVLLVVAMAGRGIGVLAEAAKLASGGFTERR